MQKQNPDSLWSFRGVGKQTANKLAKLQIFSPYDLLFHLPLRYQDRTRILSIAEVVPGAESVIEGIITRISVPKGGRTKLLCEIRDKTGRLYLRFFHVLSFQKDKLKPGTKLRCFSTVRLGNMGLEMVHPEFQILSPMSESLLENHLTPIYPATEGLSQYQIRKFTSQALDWMEASESCQELIPANMLEALAVPTLKAALQFIHKPPRDTRIEDLMLYKTVAQKRLIFEELLAHRLSLLHIKKAFQLQQALPLSNQNVLAAHFLKNLPFALTQAQERVKNEIQTDLMRPYPMLRLVQGDVGSGKTVVAALSMLSAVENGYQAVMMAPTELLAEQHYQVFQRWLNPLGIAVVLLTSSTKSSEREAILTNIVTGKALVILGTHALFQDDVKFCQLALIIVDEQHRFGVHQRALLREKGMQEKYYPHQLIMTATPIPRTLAMSLYTDLDSSTIDELPPGRTAVTTSVIANARRQEVIERVRYACQQGRQAYWVCPLIEESEKVSAQAALKTVATLRQLLPSLGIELIHGRMTAGEKDQVMKQFQAGTIHLLVATTVIEVGVDVPNASLMIIENAERLGLSQLHQLRGRVGRGAVESHCILLYQSPLSSIAKERLSVMRETTNGFIIAERDLALRGPGEILGIRQTGALSFRVADLTRDSHLFSEVKKAADIIMAEHAEVLPKLIERWVGAKQTYGKV